MQQKLELFENFISAHFHSFLTGSLFLRLSNSENLNYKIFVHDPDFFLANLNPFGIPMERLDISQDESGNFTHGSSFYKVTRLSWHNFANQYDLFSLLTFLDARGETGKPAPRRIPLQWGSQLQI